MTKEKNTFWKQKNLVLILFLLVTCLSLLKKGSHDLQEWDESRNGVNAYEMLQNSNYLNLHYDGEPDTWNAKPPLMIWLIAGSYKVFGFNEFALRFPSTLCTLAFFLLCFYTLRLLENARTAFFTCLILISSKAILGNHIGLTGDFDALLLVFLSASVYSFILYAEKHRKNAIFCVALFTGLAFYTKGPASLVLLPGFFLYLLARRKMYVFKDLKLWLAAALFLLIAGSWIIIGAKYGKTSDHSVYGSKNSIETMLIYDTYQRLTNSKFDNTTDTGRDYPFFIEVIDARLNLWNYFFYSALLIGLYLLYKSKKTGSDFINQLENRAAVLSVCLILPLSLTLTFASTKHNWYLAPVFMFTALLIVKGIEYLAEKWKLLYFIAGALLVFTLSRQINYIYSLPTEIHNALTDNEKIKASTILVTTEMRQDVFLYLKWLHVTLIKTKEALKDVPNNQNVYILMDKNHPQQTDDLQLIPFLEFDHYSLIEIKKDCQ